MGIIITVILSGRDSRYNLLMLDVYSSKKYMDFKRGGVRKIDNSLPI